MSSATNGGAITRAELAAHIRRIDENLDAIRQDVAEVRAQVAAPRHWIGGRLTAAADRVLPLGVVAALTVLIAHYT